MSTIEVDFTVPECPGFCHVKNALYLAGGCLTHWLNDFRKISASGQTIKLKSIPTAKSRFPMTYWDREDLLFTVGGWIGHKQHLDEANQYSRALNRWKSLPCLITTVYGCSATVLNNVLYCIGGGGTFEQRSSSLDLLSTKRTWKQHTVGGFNFANLFRDATVVKNEIVYFGSHERKETCILDAPKGSKNLRVKTRFDGIEYVRGYRDSSFCVCQEKIFFFPASEENEVMCLDVETKKNASSTSLSDWSILNKNFNRILFFQP